jgi:hypothetical protein
VVVVVVVVTEFPAPFMFYLSQLSIRPHQNSACIAKSNVCLLSSELAWVYLSLRQEMNSD